MKTGGYDEAKYAAWGPDDKDFHYRLRRFEYKAKEIPRRFLDVVLHNDKMRFRDYPDIVPTTQSEDFQQVCDESTIANWGKIGCGTVCRRFGSADFPPGHTRFLNPLPTRIFGIGLHKTATTSLHKALQILGFESAHWKTAHWAKAIWDEMKANGRSLTVEKSYALSDLPIGLLYKELDQAYPGSKFILTVRNENAWLKSVGKHWSHEHNPFRAAWDTDPFTHKVHNELYGRKKFDKTIFLERYRRHNAEVQEYFRGRGDDLLVLRMDEEYLNAAPEHYQAPFNQLCSFLDVPRPGVPYPREFVTA